MHWASSRLKHALPGIFNLAERGLSLHAAGELAANDSRLSSHPDAHATDPPRPQPARPACGLALCLLAVLLAVQTVWVAGRRSTIPLAIDDHVERMRLVQEHRPGADDVPLVRFAERGWVHVDRRVFDALEVGERVHKAAFARQLTHGDPPAHLPLRPSRDAWRLTWVAVAALAVCLLLGWRAVSRGASSAAARS